MSNILGSELRVESISRLGGFKYLKHLVYLLFWLSIISQYIWVL